MSDLPERCPHNHGLEECLLCNYDEDGVQRRRRFTFAELEAKVRELEQESETQNGYISRLEREGTDKNIKLTGLQAQLQAVTHERDTLESEGRKVTADYTQTLGVLAQLQARNQKLITCLEKVQFMVDRNSKSRTLIDAALADEEKP